jgi:hypothetical protein
MFRKGSGGGGGANNNNGNLADSLYALMRNSNSPRLFSRLVEKEK